MSESVFFCENPGCPNHVETTPEIARSGTLVLPDTSAGGWTSSTVAIKRNEFAAPDGKSRLWLCGACAKAVELSRDFAGRNPDSRTARGNVVFSGDVSVVEDADDPGPTKYERALLIQFPTAEELRRAILGQRAVFSIFGR